MDIIKRNFFRILLSGALGENEALEPMTRFKWNRLVQMIKAQDVVAIAIDGLSQHSHDEGCNMPSDILDDLASSDGNIEDKRFDFSHHIEVPELSNTLLDNRLKKIFDEERHAIDTNIHSLRLLAILVDNVQTILNHGMSLGGILSLGKFLRTQGGKVDFVKIDDWLQHIHMRRMAQLQGSILIKVFNFEQDEIPFVTNIEPYTWKIIMRTIDHQAIDTAQEWHFKQTRSGFVQNNATVLRRNLRRSLGYITYAPIETTSNFISNFARSLSEIEE